VVSFYFPAVYVEHQNIPIKLPFFDSPWQPAIKISINTFVWYLTLEPEKQGYLKSS